MQAHDSYDIDKIMKYKLTIILFLFTYLSLPIIQCTARQNTNISELSNKLEKTNETIDELNKRIKLLENESLDAKKKLELAEQLADISEKNLSIPTHVYPIIGVSITLLLALAGYALRRETIGKVENLEDKFHSLEDRFHRTREFLDTRLKIIRSNLKDEKVRLSNLNKANHWALGLIYSLLSVQVYKDNPERSIMYGEQALDNYGKGQFTESEETTELTIAIAKSNLAYFYALANNDDKRMRALVYAKSGLEVFMKSNSIDFIDNFLFVYKNYASTEDDKILWIKIYIQYREQIKKYLGESAPEWNDYESYKNSLEEEIEIKK